MGKRDGRKMMMMIISPFGRLGLFAPSLGAQDIFNKNSINKIKSNQIIDASVCLIDASARCIHINHVRFHKTYSPRDDY